MSRVTSTSENPLIHYAKRTVIVGLMAVVSAIALGILQKYYPHYPMSAAACISGGAGAILFSCSIVLYFWKRNEEEAILDEQMKLEISKKSHSNIRSFRTRGTQTDEAIDESTEEKFKQNGAQVVTQFVFVPYMKNVIPSVFLPSSLMKAMFAEDQDEKWVMLGNNVYLALENPALAPASIAISHYQNILLKKDMGFDYATDRSPILIFPVDSASIQQAYSVAVKVGVYNSQSLDKNYCFIKKDKLTEYVSKQYTDKAIKSGQQQILRMDDVELILTFSSLTSSSFKITKETILEFDFEDIYFDEEIPTTDTTQLKFTLLGGKVSKMDQELRLKKQYFFIQKNISEIAFLVPKNCCLFVNEMLETPDGGFYMLSEISAKDKPDQKFRLVKFATGLTYDLT